MAFDFTSLPWTLDLSELRDYFGERITLYFAFIGHYSKWLLIPAAIGIIFQLIVWGTLDFSSPVLPFYCVIIALWAVTMLGKDRSTPPSPLFYPLLTLF